MANTVYYSIHSVFFKMHGLPGKTITSPFFLLDSNSPPLAMAILFLWLLKLLCWSIVHKIIIRLD